MNKYISLFLVFLLILLVVLIFTTDNVWGQDDEEIVVSFSCWPMTNTFTLSVVQGEIEGGNIQVAINGHYVGEYSYPPMSANENFDLFSYDCDNMIDYVVTGDIEEAYNYIPPNSTPIDNSLPVTEDDNILVSPTSVATVESLPDTPAPTAQTEINVIVENGEMALNSHLEDIRLKLRNEFTFNTVNSEITSVLSNIKQALFE